MLLNIQIKSLDAAWKSILRQNKRTLMRLRQISFINENITTKNKERTRYESKKRTMNLNICTIVKSSYRDSDTSSDMKVSYFSWKKNDKRKNKPICCVDIIASRDILGSCSHFGTILMVSLQEKWQELNSVKLFQIL